MLTKEETVCTKEQSRELIYLGVNMVTFYVWTEHRDTHGTLNLLEERWGIQEHTTPAFTIHELAAIGGFASGPYDARALASKVIRRLKARKKYRILYLISKLFKPIGNISFYT